MTENEVTDWAWKQVAIEDVPSYALLKLAEDGPQRCLKRSELDFTPRPIKLNYVQELSLRVVQIQMESDDAMLELVKWAAARVIGEDITDDLVQLGYGCYHLINDCANTEAALALARAELPKFIPRCKNVAAEFALSAA
jgi:hypothetical protein